MAISNITLTGSVSLMPAWNATDGTASFGGTDIAAYQYLKEFTNGSGANQINEIYRKRRLHEPRSLNFNAKALSARSD